MAFVKFKKLNHLINMPATITDGCIYFVKDAKKIFADFNSERTEFSISEAEVYSITESSINESFADLLAKLEAVEATLNPEVQANYAELLANLKEIGQYSTTAEVQEMVAGVNKIKITNKLDKMQRDRTHIFKVKNRYISEEIALNKRFSGKM